MTCRHAWRGAERNYPDCRYVVSFCGKCGTRYPCRGSCSHLDCATDRGDFAGVAIAVRIVVDGKVVFDSAG